MKGLKQSEYETLTAGAIVVTYDQFGSKVLRLPDGRYVKLFRLKRKCSSARFWPYAKRFRRGAVRLRKRGVPTIDHVSLFRVKPINRDGVIYRPLEGQTLREALQDPKKRQDLVERFSHFLANLHGKGIYFRAIHFGNVIDMPDGSLGLIDVSEARFSAAPLGIIRRAKNFTHFLRYKMDRDAIEDFGYTRFIDSYYQFSGLPRILKRPFEKCLHLFVAARVK